MREKISAEQAIEKMYECLNEIEWLCSDYTKSKLDYGKDPFYIEPKKESERTPENWNEFLKSIETFGINVYKPGKKYNITNFLTNLKCSLEHMEKKSKIYETLIKDF